MTRSKRPKLGDILRGEQSTPSPAPILEDTQQGRGEAEVPTVEEKPVEKMVQLNVTVPPELRRNVRIKALQQGVEVSSVVRELLQEWLDR